jgi:peptide/nickel transport system substrate-binding protein
MERQLKVGKRMMLIGVVLLVALSLFVTESPAQPTPQGNLNAKPEGTLNVAVASLGEEGFIPDLGGMEQSRAYVNVLEYPFYINGKNGNIIPGLATSYEYSKDYRTLTLHMRKGIPWQDKEKWGEVTAEDVKYTFERAMRDGSTSGVKKLLLQTVESVEVPDPYTFVVHQKKVAPDTWRNFFAIQTTGMPIVCKKYIETVGEDKARWEPIGSGPYRLVERKTGQYLKFEAVEKHWRVVPEFKYLVIHIVPEETTGIAMLKTGNIDALPITNLQVAGLYNVPGIKLIPWPGGYYLCKVFGGMITPKDTRYKEGYHRTDPWKDIRVRQAMTMAIDRQAIIKAIYKGGAEAQPIYYSLPGWETLPPIPYDPAKAKQLLAEAGYPNGFSFKLVAATGWVPAFEIPQVTEAIGAYFTAIGLKPEIILMDNEQLSNLCREAKDVGMIYTDKETFKLNFSGRFYDKFSPESEPAIFVSDEHSAVIDAYEKEIDPQKRAAALAALRDFQYKETVAIPIVHANATWAYRTSVVGDVTLSIVDKLHYFEYVRHPKPLNTWRLFNPYY